MDLLPSVDPLMGGVFQNSRGGGGPRPAELFSSHMRTRVLFIGVIVSPGFEEELNRSGSTADHGSMFDEQIKIWVQKNK